MSSHKGLVLDANILIRATLGRRVRSLLETYQDSITFYAPDICFDDTPIPGIFDDRARDPEIGWAVLNQIALIVQVVDQVLYRDFEQLARERVAVRDVGDWPIVAVALMLNLPIWTEDRDFFCQRYRDLDDGPRGTVLEIMSRIESACV